MSTDKKEDIKKLKEIEDERENIMKDLEEEMKNLDLKYEKIMSQVIEKRNQHTQDKELYSHFWLRVFSNHRMFKDLVNESDEEALKALKGVKGFKLDDGNVRKLVILVFQTYF